MRTNERDAGRPSSMSRLGCFLVAGLGTVFVALSVGVGVMVLTVVLGFALPQVDHHDLGGHAPHHRRHNHN